MTWRNRKLFNDLPQGIVSGLEPIPRYKEGGFVNPRNYIGGGTVEYPIGMEAGTLVPEVFESGDQQINDALNNALSVTGVTNDMITKDLPKVDVAKTTAPSLDVSEEPKSINMVDSINETVDMLTSQYKEAAKSLVEQTKQNIQLEENPTDFNLEKLEKDLEEKLELLDEEYKSILQEVLYEVDMPLDSEKLQDVTLFDQDFKQELETKLTQDLGLENLDKEKISLSETNIPKLEHGGIHPTPEEIYNQRMQEKADKRRLARTGSLFSGKTLEGGIGGVFDVIGQSQTAESNKITPENRIDMSTARTAEYKQDQAFNILNDASLTEEQKSVMLSALGINLGSGDSDATGTMKNVAEVKRIQNRARTQIAAIEANSSLSDSEKQKQKDLIKQREKYELDVLGVDLAGTDEKLNASAYKQAIAMAKIVINIPESEYYGGDPINVAYNLYAGLTPGQPNPFANQLSKPGD